METGADGFLNATASFIYFLAVDNHNPVYINEHSLRTHADHTDSLIPAP